MAYHFALSYLNQYPAEKVGPSSFACDKTIRNAKFESSLRALAVPVSEVEKPIFRALAAQEFTLHFGFINTAISCTKFSLSEVIDSSTSPLPRMACTSTSGTLMGSVILPQHAIIVRAVLDDVQLVGGLRIGISGPGLDNELHALHELNFSEVLFSPSGQTLSQQTTIQLALTKVSSSHLLHFRERERIECARLSMKLSLSRKVNPSSEASGIRRSPTARARCSTMRRVTSP